MKKLVITILFIMAVIPEAMAQRHYVPHVHVGGHGGATLSQVSFYPKAKESMLAGATMGVSFRYAEERHVGLLAELNFMQAGWKENFEELNPIFSYYHRTDYITLPVMTHIFFGSRVVKCFFNLGPQVGYMIGDAVSSNFDYENPKNIEDFPSDYRQTDQMRLKIKNKFDYGITGGVGIEFVIKKRHSVMLEGRYYYGLGNIFPSSKADEFSASRGNTILVTLGYMYRLK